MPVRAERTLLSFLVLFSFLAACPRLSFSPHCFILLLPAVALLIGLAVSAARDRLERYGLLRVVPVLVFLGACVYPIARQSEFLFELDPIAACRQSYGINPFPE